MENPSGFVIFGGGGLGPSAGIGWMILGRKGGDGMGGNGRVDMKMLYKHLRFEVCIGWMVAWFGLMAWAFWLNEGIGVIRVMVAFVPLSIAMFGTAALGLLIVHIPGVRARLLKPGGDFSVIKADLQRVAMTTGALGVLMPLIGILGR